MFELKYSEYTENLPEYKGKQICLFIDRFSLVVNASKFIRMLDEEGSISRSNEINISRKFFKIYQSISLISSNMPDRSNRFTCKE